MKVVKGYKQTEFGLIPEDWEVKPISEVYEICNNLRFPINERIREKMKGEYPYYGPTKIQDFINEYRIDGEYCLIGEDGDHFLKWNEMSMTILVSGKFNVNNHAHIVKAKDNLLSWFYYFFRNRNITQHLTRQGAGRYKLTKAALKEISIAFPPTKKEQTVIANTLSDADEFISTLEKLIEKKQNIKQGTMQVLLTGKKRLKGFKEGWKLKKLSEVGNCFAGGTPSTFKAEYWNGDIIWLPSGRVQNNIIKKIVNEKTITQLGLDESSARLIKQNSVLVAITGATCGNIGLLEFSATANQSVVAIEPNEKTDCRFLYYKLLTKRNDILTMQTGSAQGGVNLKAIKSIEILFPPVAEQNAIARILSDIDSEIEELQNQLAKYKLVKEGMMQNLLTGKIRLVNLSGHSG